MLAGDFPWVSNHSTNEFNVFSGPSKLDPVSLRNLSKELIAVLWE